MTWDQALAEAEAVSLDTPGDQVYTNTYVVLKWGRVIRQRTFTSATPAADAKRWFSAELTDPDSKLALILKT